LTHRNPAPWETYICASGNSEYFCTKVLIDG
jgi:hypothetical protein